nr:HGGxSTG domain-containing protein [Roseicyclus sp.]
MKFRKGNTIGIVTRFGPDWPGVRCGAKTRSGEPCKKASMKGRSRCRNHGGEVDRTSDRGGTCSDRGRADDAWTVDERGPRRGQAAGAGRARDPCGAKEIERWAVSEGLLDRDWKDQFKPLNQPHFQFISHRSKERA